VPSRFTKRSIVELGFRSGLEESVADQLRSLNISYKYEPVRLAYLKPAKPSTYQPDFILPNGIVIETKGRFVTADRQKHKLIKEQFPNLDIRFVFSNSKTRLTKASKTTYAKWSEQYGFKWADKLVPVAWINEPKCEVRWAAIKEATKK
jgi:hypothetical protein